MLVVKTGIEVLRQKSSYNNTAPFGGGCWVSMTGRFHRHSAAGWAECTVAGPGRVRRQPHTSLRDRKPAELSEFIATRATRPSNRTPHIPLTPTIQLVAFNQGPAAPTSHKPHRPQRESRALNEGQWRPGGWPRVQTRPRTPRGIPRPCEPGPAERQGRGGPRRRGGGGTRG